MLRSPVVQIVVFFDTGQPGEDFGTVQVHLPILREHIRRDHLVKRGYLFYDGIRYLRTGIIDGIQERNVTAVHAVFFFGIPRRDKVFGPVPAHLLRGECLEIPHQGDYLDGKVFRTLVLDPGHFHRVDGRFRGEGGPQSQGIFEPLRGPGIVPFCKLQGGQGALRTAPIGGVSLRRKGNAVLPHELQRGNGAVGKLPGHMDGRSPAIRFYSVVDPPLLKVRLNDGGIPQDFERHVHQTPGRSPLLVQERLMCMERDGFHLMGRTFLFVAQESDPAGHLYFPPVYSLAAVGKRIAPDFPAAPGKQAAPALLRKSHVQPGKMRIHFCLDQDMEP